MKCIRLAVLSLGIVGLCSLTFVQVGRALNFQAGTLVNVGQATNGSLYVAGKAVNVSSDVDGDVFCAGQNVVISGIVRGDVICAGQSITISGTVEGNIRLIGQSVAIDGTIGRNASIIAQQATINQPIAGDLSFAGGDLVLNRSVGRDVALAANSATINSLVARDITGRVNTLLLGSQANVAGTISYTSNTNATVAGGAQLHAIHRSPLPVADKRSGWMMWSMGLGGVLYFLLAGLFTSLIIVLIVPGTLRRISDQAVKHLGWAWLVGFIASIVAPVTAVLLAITIVGAPLALMFISGWLVVSFFSFSASAYYAGRLLLPKSGNAIATMLVGTLAMSLLMVIPVVNVITIVAAYWVGVGSILLALRGKMQRPVYILEK